MKHRPAEDQTGLAAQQDQAAAYNTYRLQAYRSNLLAALCGGLLAATLLVVLLGNAVPAVRLYSWLAAAALALMLRMAIGLWHTRSTVTPADEGRWLWRYRGGLLLQGVVWAGVAFLPLPPGDLVAEAMRAVVIVGLVGGSFSLLAFDLAGALGFSLLCQGTLGLRVLLQGVQQDEPVMVVLALAGLATLVFMMLAAQRSNSMTRRHVALQHTAQVQAAALADSQAQLAAKSAALQQTLDSISQGIANVDAAGRVRAYNQRTVELLDLPDHLLTEGTRFEDVRAFQRARGDLPPGYYLDAEAKLQVLPEAREDAPPVYLRRDHRGRMLEVRSRMLADGGMVRTYTDVTDYLRSQQALTAAKEEAERANRAKSQFLSGMSHELRTPLNAVLGFGQVLLSDQRHPLHADHRQPVVEVIHAADHLLRLINDLLDLSVLESGRLQVSLAPVPLGPMLGSGLALVQPLADEAGVRLPAAAQRLDVAAQLANATVWADRTRLQQIMLNLLSNAIKYNHCGGRVSVRCEPSPDAAPDGRPRIRVLVQDDGPGLDAAQCARLFTPFERLGAARSAEMGAGLGLALSRGLARAMGGDMGVISQPGQGSRFWVDLPRGPQVPELHEQPESDRDLRMAASLGPLFDPDDTVLYVEDNPVNAMLMASMLERLGGPELLVASRGDEGLGLARQHRLRLVLVDIELPDMSGFALLQQLLQVPECAGIPILAVSANALPDDIAEGMAAGFSDYLTKPVSLSRLRSALTAALRGAMAPG